MDEQKLLTGDPAAFEAFVTAYERQIYTYCLRQTGSAEDAADLTQEVFLRAWRGLPGFAGRSSLRTWLYQIAVHACIDLARSKGRRVQEVPLEAESDGEIYAIEVPDWENAPEIRLERKEQRRLVAEGLAALPEDARQVLLLRETGGLSYREIAEMLDLEEGTVKSRISRAREKLCCWLRKKDQSIGNQPSQSSSKKRKGDESDGAL